MTGGARADLVLVGGGHAHVQVLRRWMMRPVSGVRLTVVLDRPEAVYSGMVPGLVAGDYTASELAIDVVPLARRAGASVVLAAATRVDAVARRIALDGRPSLAYDVASLDVGSTVRGLDLPGVRQHALATRPVGDLVARLEAAVRAAAARRAGASLRVVVVGGGVAGVELACTLRARILAAGAVPAVTVVADSADVLPGYPAHVARRMAREASRRGITLRTGTRATGVEPDAVVLGTERLASDLSLWATGAAPGPLLAASDLPHDAAGFVRVETTLAVVGHDGLFAVGDCAAIAGAPFVRKAGVYAVREGPILDANLRARLGGRPLRRYRPQRAFLALVNLGEGRALAFKWRCVAAGRWVWRWKDSIDRRFVRRFQVLDARGAPLPAFSATMDGAGTMRCGGCAAKVSAAALERALARLGPPREDASVLLGLGRPDDAAALVLPAGRVQLATVDAFRAFAPDPWLVGRVAAVNAVSDVLAKGGVARHALAIVTVPEDDAARAEETLFQALAGVRAALDPLDVSLVGGHSTSGPELFVGLAVTGELPPETPVLGLEGLRPGQALILTKALGTGVVLAADMQGRAAGGWVLEVCASMLRPNAAAAAVARRVGARACTDVSGFGLAGHLLGLLRASGCSARVALEALPALAGAQTLLAAGVRSTFHATNAEARVALEVEPAAAADARLELLFDPQTSGGLLFGVDEARAGEAVAALHAAGDQAATVIGVIEPPAPGRALLRVETR